MEYRYTGIILSKKDIGETDRMYFAYTLECGKIKIVARGIRKSRAKLAGALENFTLTNIFVAKNRGNGNITGAVAEQSFLPIKNNFEATRAVFSDFNLVEKLVTWEDPDKKIFTLLQEYLLSMENILKNNKKEEKINLLSAAFKFKLFEMLGYLVEMNSCVLCGGKIFMNKNYFSSRQGGVICPECFKREKEALPISSNAVKSVRIFQKNSLSSIHKLSVQEKDLRNIKLIIDNFILYL